MTCLTPTQTTLFKLVDFYCTFFFSYSVIVQMVESQCLEAEKSDTGTLCRQLTWPQLCGVSRVSGHAAKVLTLCFMCRIITQNSQSEAVIKKIPVGVGVSVLSFLSRDHTK